MSVQRPFDKVSPNSDIDAALKQLMRDVKDRKKCPHDVAVKIINSAIAWEKVKHAIEAKDEDFDPDE